MTKVKTVCKSFRMDGKESWVSEYPTLKEAEAFIRATLRWGIGIVSCEIVEEE